MAINFSDLGGGGGADAPPGGGTEITTTTFSKWGQVTLPTAGTYAIKVEGNSDYVAIDNKIMDNRTYAGKTGQWIYVEADYDNTVMQIGRPLFSSLNNISSSTTTYPSIKAYNRRTNLPGTASAAIFYAHQNLWIIGDTNGKIFTASNGVSFTQQGTMTSFERIYGFVETPDGAMIAYGNGNKIMRSTNGTSWSSITVPFSNVKSGRYGEGKLVIGGPQGRTARSTDGGLTWTENGQIPLQEDVLDIIYSSGRWVACIDFSETNPRYANSVDGINWMLRSFPQMANISDRIASGCVVNNNFCVSYGMTVWTSDNTYDWDYGTQGDSQIGGSGYNTIAQWGQILGQRNGTTNNFRATSIDNPYSMRSLYANNMSFSGSTRGFKFLAAGNDRAVWVNDAAGSFIGGFERQGMMGQAIVYKI